MGIVFEQVVFIDIINDLFHAVSIAFTWAEEFRTSAGIRYLMDIFLLLNSRTCNQVISNWNCKRDTNAWLTLVLDTSFVTN